MPAPQIVPASDAPERFLPTKPKSEGLRMLIEQVESVRSELTEVLGHPDSSVMFHLTTDDSPDFERTGVRLDKVKDAYRRMMRKALDEHGIDSSQDGPYTVRYEFFWTRTTKGEIRATGFRAFVMAREGNE